MRWTLLSAAAALLAAQPGFAQTRSLGITALQNASAYRQESGNRVTVVCPASDGKTGSVYGTDLYTDDSSICASAIHAGVLKPQQAGVVSIDLVKGAQEFRGSARNGVTSRNYGRWDYAFRFASDAAAGNIGWAAVWAVPAGFTDNVVVACPAGGKTDAAIWGTDVYTTDSAICVAAVHAGVITAAAGGSVAVQRAPALSEYPATTRRGVASKRWGALPNAFRVTAVGPAPATLAATGARAASRTAPATESSAVRAGAPTTTSPQEPLSRAPTAANGRSPISPGSGPANTIGPDSVSAPAGPPPTALVVTGTQATATITWNAPAGATGFDVYRSPSAGSLTKLSPSPLSATRFEDRTGFVAVTSYVYRVVPQFAGGAGAYAEVTFQPPAPVNPAWARATAQGKDIVVTWAPVPGVASYTVAGQSSAEWRDVAGTVTSVTYYNVPPGSYEYRVASVYQPGAVQSAVAAWTLATISTRPTSGRYRISITGLRVNNHTHDDLLHGDGRADEIYAAAVVAEIDRQKGQVRRTDFVQSEVHGDANGFANRQQAGSSSATGGLVRGDAVPAGFYPQTPSAPSSLPGRFPLTLWEGTLNDGADAIVIRPTLWEWDGDPISFYAWRDSLLAPTNNLWSTAARNASAGTVLAVLRAGRTRLFHTALGQPYGGTPYTAGYEVATRRDRPIGLDDLVLNQPDPLNDYSRVYWVERLLVVTREIIEAALAGPSSQQLAPGVVAMPLVEVDTPSVETTINGDYVVYLRVERLP